MSTWLSTQKLKLPLITPCVRVNCTAILAFRLRNQVDLWDGLIHELSALVSKQQLYDMYQASVATAFNFLYIDLLAKDVNHMFYSGFSERFVVDSEE